MDFRLCDNLGVIVIVNPELKTLLLSRIFFLLKRGLGWLLDTVLEKSVQCDLVCLVLWLVPGDKLLKLTYVHLLA